MAIIFYEIQLSSYNLGVKITFSSTRGHRLQIQKGQLSLHCKASYYRGRLGLGSDLGNGRRHKRQKSDDIEHCPQSF